MLLPVRFHHDLQRGLVRRSGAAEVALLLVEHGHVGVGIAHIGVEFAQRLQACGQDHIVQLQSACIGAALEEHDRHVVIDVGDVHVVPVHGFQAYCEGLCVQVPCIVQTPHVLVHCADGVEAVGDLQAVRTGHLPPDREGLLVHFQGALIRPESLVRHGHLVVHVGNGVVLLAVGPPPDGQRLLGCFQSVVVGAAVIVRLGQGRVRVAQAHVVLARGLCPDDQRLFEEL
mmetsp:Transcript_31312/g.91310  ORF Transcript_31312/g.91310 Transcript_31312/m.91310 type:complete len:229 (-) Transcript_31312:390-1076(-)